MRAPEVATGTTRVTVLMPCRNAGPSYFREALNSVYSQSSPWWKLCVIDDRTTDAGTLQILHQLSASTDERIAVVESEAKHITGALNTGMRHATTPFVCALHCDDLMDLNTIEVLSDHIERYPEVDYFHTSRRFVDEGGQPLSKVYRAADSFCLSDFKAGSPVKSLHCWRVAAAREVGGMDESLGLHGGDDYDFPWRMARAGKRFKAIPDCVYVIRDHREHYRLTTHVPLETQINHLRRIWEKHGLGEEEMAELIRSRRVGHLRQALYLTDEDKQHKEMGGFDPRTGFRVKYCLPALQPRQGRPSREATLTGAVSSFLSRLRGLLMLKTKAKLTQSQK